nr:MAG TPA: hypothetical protein [Caudoviricetes sp.]
MTKTTLSYSSLIGKIPGDLINLRKDALNLSARGLYHACKTSETASAGS